MTNEELLTLWRHNQRSDLLLALYEQNKRLICKWINPYVGVAEREDLMQEAFFGVCEAAKRFEPTAGVKFTTYLRYWVMEAVTSYLFNVLPVVKIPPSIRQKISKLKKGSAAYEQIYSHTPDIKELSAFLGWSVEEAVEIQALTTHAISLDAPIVSESDTALSDTLTDDSVNVEEEAIEGVYTDTLKDVWGLVAENTTDKENAVILGYYRRSSTLKDIANSLGISVERARQLKANGLARIRRSKARLQLLEKYEIAETRSYRFCGYGSFHRSWSSVQEFIAIEKEKAEARYKKQIKTANQILSGGS